MYYLYKNLQQCVFLGFITNYDIKMLVVKPFRIEVRVFFSIFKSLSFFSKKKL